MIIPNLSIIVAVDSRNAIGYKGELLCHLPDDLKRFKELTTGHTVIMGRKTYESLPKRPLPNRRNVVISTHQPETAGEVDYLSTIEEVYSLARETKGELFVIGGQSLYEQLIHQATTLYVTRIHHQFEHADVFFPIIDAAEWELKSQEPHTADEKHAYDFSFEVYTRKDKQDYLEEDAE